MDRETRLKRLYFRSAHRGSKEADLLLGPYAAAHLTTLDNAALDAYEAFLEESDNDIWDWVSGKSRPDNEHYGVLIAALQKQRH